jgi:hypothetical protein
MPYRIVHIATLHAIDTHTCTTGGPLTCLTIRPSRKKISDKDVEKLKENLDRCDQSQVCQKTALRSTHQETNDGGREVREKNK